MIEKPLPDIMVLDRQRPDFDQAAWSLRRVLTVDIGSGFAKWATSGERGRFLILTLAGTLMGGLSIEEIFVFTDDTEELFKIVSEKADAIAKALNRSPSISVMVTAELFERFKAHDVRTLSA